MTGSSISAAKCARIGITINDDRITVADNEFTGALTGNLFDSDAASYASAADADPATNTKAQALCEVEQGV